MKNTIGMNMTTGHGARRSDFKNTEKKTIIVNPTLGLAMLAPVERTCADAHLAVDPEAAERLCRVWAEVGRAILLRRIRA